MTTDEHPARAMSRRSMDCVARKAKDEWVALFAEDGFVQDPVGPSPLDETGEGHHGHEAIGREAEAPEEEVHVQPLAVLDGQHQDQQSQGDRPHQRAADAAPWVGREVVLQHGVLFHCGRFRDFACTLPERGPR
jgi:ketosteroid isomerase-like protein